MKKPAFAFLLSNLIMLASCPLLLAQTPEEKGLAIAHKMKATNLGWNDSIASMELVLYDNRGNESLRKLRMKMKEVSDDGDKGLMIFDEPKDVRGTLFLNISHALVPDDQWIYLPSLKRVKRISSKNKSGPFLGSEFAYEDVGSFEVEKYSYTYLGDEACGEHICHMIKQIPLYTDSGYVKMRSWIDTQEFQQRKVEFYDRKDALLKTLTLSDYQIYLDKYWRSHKQTMVNHQTGSRTDLITKTQTFQVGMDDSEFTQRALKRIY